jgi:HEPN domain-containing protein
MKKVTAPWIRKAESDLKAAKSLAAAKPPFYDEACFHGQQAAEKFFKALLQEWGLHIPKTHELDMLRDLLVTHDPTLNALKRKLDWLTQYAVDYRYPGFHANARKAKTAIKMAERIRLEVRIRLRLRTKS